MWFRIHGVMIGRFGGNMGECAFCPHTGKLSLEHITSQWMGEMFPAPKRFTSKDHLGNEKEWTDTGLEMKARVVCEKCNTGWMSDIESKHARPVMAPLMSGEISASFGKNEARSLALFAFKTAVVVDHAHSPEGDRFFSRRQRYAFREHLFIPQNVVMWLAPFIPQNRRRRFDYRISHHKGELAVGYELQRLTCTCNFGFLAFQVVAHKQLFNFNFAPLPGFEGLAVPFWPSLDPGFVWSGYGGLKSREEIIAFHRRWDEVTPI
jgi:hypothetical protein